MTGTETSVPVVVPGHVPPYYQDAWLTIHGGDCRTVMAEMAPEFVQSVVTSPPYFGLRDYGIEPSVWGDGWSGVLGLEPTIDAYVAHMVEVFRGVRRVLRKDGTVWLNLGDSYAGSWGAQSRESGNEASTWARTVSAHPKQTKTGTIRSIGLKPKDRMMVPARVAIALQADGWWLRDEIVWHKPNPMPSSVTDRTTPAHEMVYLLTRSARYSIDMTAIQEPAIYAGPNGAQLSPYGQGFTRRSAALSFDRATKEADIPGQSARQHRVGRDAKQAQTAANSCPSTTRTMGGFNGRWDEAEATGSAPLTRNKRSVWTIPTAPYPEAHFATFPPKLVEPCIIAGSKPGDVILDPFGGSGTVGMVAQMHSRRAVLVDMNPDYLAQCLKRNAQSPLGLES